MENNDGKRLDKRSSSKKETDVRYSKKDVKATENDSDTNSSISKCSTNSKRSNKSHESNRKIDHIMLLNTEMNDRNEEVVLKKKQPRYTNKRNPGRVQKRRPKPKRRLGVRKPATRKTRRFKDIDAASFVSSRNSLSCCLRCGHRCCRRRLEQYWSSPRFRERRNNKRYERVKKYKKKRIPFQPTRRRVRRKLVKEEQQPLPDSTLDSAAVQVGSTCAGLSPLCIKTNQATTAQNEEDNYLEITPQMIHQAMRCLSMWRQHVPTEMILKYLQCNHKLNPDIDELWVELNDKLRVATIVGIIMNVSDNLWAVTTALHRKRNISKNHVTLFWSVYGDTMSPVTRRPDPQPNPLTDETGTEDSNIKRMIQDYEIL